MKTSSVQYHDTAMTLFVGLVMAGSLLLFVDMVMSHVEKMKKADAQYHEMVTSHAMERKREAQMIEARIDAMHRLADAYIARHH